MTSVAIDSPDPVEELRRLEGQLYDAAHAAHEASWKWRGLPDYRAEFIRNARELRDLAGYVARVAGTRAEAV